MERTLDTAVKQAVQVLYEAEEATHRQGKIAGAFLLCSGGYDSLVTSHLSDENIRCQVSRSYWGFNYNFPKLVYINTRIGIEANRRFVQEYAHWYVGDDRFHEYVTPESYEDWCMRHGFPGKPAHRWMYIRLKERALNMLVRDHTFSIDRSVLREILGDMDQLLPPHQFFLMEQIRASLRKAFEARHQPVIFFTGARQQESARRAQHVMPIQVRGRQIWVSPLADWSKKEVLDYRDDRRLPHNDVADLCGRSKDCCCGAMAHEGELEEIELFYPEEGAYLRDLQNRVMAAGFPWKWGHSPPSWWNEQKKGQLPLWPEQEGQELNGIPKESDAGFFPMCSTCNVLACLPDDHLKGKIG